MRYFITKILTFKYVCVGYSWSWVNHDQHYVDPITGDHTNKIESSWFAVKRQLPRGGSYDLKRFDSPRYSLRIYAYMHLQYATIFQHFQWYTNILMDDTNILMDDGK